MKQNTKFSLDIQSVISECICSDGVRISHATVKKKTRAKYPYRDIIYKVIAELSKRESNEKIMILCYDISQFYKDLVECIFTNSTKTLPFTYAEASELCRSLPRGNYAKITNTVCAIDIGRFLGSCSEIKHGYHTNNDFITRVQVMTRGYRFNGLLVEGSEKQLKKEVKESLELSQLAPLFFPKRAFANDSSSIKFGIELPKRFREKREALNIKYTKK